MNSRLLQAARVFSPPNLGNELLFGNLQLGYYGQVSSANFYSAHAIATGVGVTAGTVCNTNTTTWLKFAYKGKILYISKQLIRTDVTMNHLKAAQVVTGNKTIVIAGKTYKIRLMKSPAAQSDASKPLNDNEWHALMYRVCREGPGGLPKWDDIPYSEIQTIPEGFSQPMGDTWMDQQFTINGGYVTLQTRGRESIDSFHYLNNGSTTQYKSSAWRPVLELVP